jgi:hypothetical protein
MSAILGGSARRIARRARQHVSSVQPETIRTTVEV